MTRKQIRQKTNYELDILQDSLKKQISSDVNKKNDIKRRIEKNRNLLKYLKRIKYYRKERTNE